MTLPAHEGRIREKLAPQQRGGSGHNFRDEHNALIPRKAAGAVTLERQDDQEPAHLVGRWHYFLDRLRLKVPRALCGELLVADPDQPGPSPNSPLCPRCVDRGGTRGQFVDTHWIVTNPVQRANPVQRRAAAAKGQKPASAPGQARNDARGAL